MVVQVSHWKNLESMSQTTAVLLASPTKCHGFITLHRVFSNTKPCSLSSHSSELASHREVLISEEAKVTFSFFLSVEQMADFLRKSDKELPKSSRGISKGDARIS